MSKLIESLKASAREFTTRTHAPLEEAPAKKSSYEMTQEQLADIYFSNSEKTKKSELPMVLKVIERRYSAPIAPWIIASVALLITGFSLFSTKRVFIDIKVVDDPYLQGASAVRESAKTTEPEAGNEIPLTNTSFDGAAKLNSRRDDKGGLTLVNSSISSFARVNVAFSPPLNLAGAKIVFYAKGQKGGENLSIALKDGQNVSAFEGGSFFPFAAGLSASWKKAEIPLSGMSQDFDVKKITNLRIDFGSKETGNKNGDTIFVKDFQVVPL